MADAKKIQTVPSAFLVKRVSPTTVILQQEMHNELSTYVCEGKHGLLDEILHRFLGAIADEPKDPLVAAAPELLVALRSICDSKSETEEYAAIVAAEALMTRIGGAS